MSLFHVLFINKKYKVILILKYACKFNMAADWLAKFGAMRDESLVELENPPQGICYLIVADVMGARFSRV